MIPNRINTLFLIAAIFVSCTLFAQKNSDVLRVDKNGRMVWKNGQEAFFWGVNYTTPFAHAFRQIARVGEDREKVIDADTYHLSRLGINAYRIHVWDYEISDSLGNLLDNEHLKLLDYLIFRFQERGVYVFLTPIAYWDNGYPEPKEDLPGFSGNYTKGNVYLEPAAIAAQERYLKQFVNHVNPYTGKAYKNDPGIIGFEVCNEPGHSKPAETTTFVEKMITTIKSTGCTKPVFYNVTQNISLLEDYIKGGTDGVTFQWYPSGLVSGHEVKGNFLPHVDSYPMPFKNEKYFANQARLVYEFDAADVGRSYMYPPMAISFKEAGMQWVTMFAYDPLAIASSNTEYQTHFLNLIYAPQKALGFKIAGELFRNPQYKRDRENEKKQFDIKGVNISYKEDLSELVTNEMFFYTNNTSSKPENASSLKSIAGYGTSPIVSYKGRGAYFLDKISDSVWRLEVMPDALWVRDPFSRATPKIENVVIKWSNYEMGVDLPDLGGNFSVTGVNEGNSHTSFAYNGKFTIAPGAYILSSKPFNENTKNAKIGAISANEYYAPKETNKKFYFLHHAPTQVSEGQPIEVTVEVVSPESSIKSMVVQLFSDNFRGRRRSRPQVVLMEKVDGYLYKAIIPDSLVRAGILTYVIKAEYKSGKETVYPGGIDGPTTSWEYNNPESYSVKVLPKGSEIQLYNAESSNEAISYFGNSGMRSSLVLSGVPGETSMQFTAVNPDNTSKRPNSSNVIYAMENYVGGVVSSISKYADTYSQILVQGKAIDKPVLVEISLISKDGNAYSAKTIFSADQSSKIIHLNDFAEGRMLLLPRPYPVFLPLWYTNKVKKTFSLSEMEKIQFVVPEEGNESLAAFELTSIALK